MHFSNSNNLHRLQASLASSLAYPMSSLLQPLKQTFGCCSAYRDVDESEQDFMGSKLVVSFANPAKHYDNHAIRPQNNGSGSALAGGANGKLGLRANIGAAGGLLTGRSGLGNKPGFNDRLSPTGSFANARGGCCGSVWLAPHRMQAAAAAIGVYHVLQVTSTLQGSLGRGL